MPVRSFAFVCGHEGETFLERRMSRRDKDGLIEWHEGRLCPDCYSEQIRKQHADENAAAAPENAANGLPTLIGSEKQIAWAESIRRKKLATLDTELNGLTVVPGMEGRVEVALANFRSHSEARWWIDNRDERVLWLLKAEVERAEVPLPDDEAKLAADAEAEAIVEATVRPENPVTETVAEIRVKEQGIEVHFPERREDFREIVRFKLRYRWDSDVRCWYRKLNSASGTREDRAAELGHALLSARFIIRLFDTEIREAAIGGTFEPEHRRWVYRRVSGSYEGWFAIQWPRGEEFYKAARKLPRSRWDKPHVVVPAEHFEQVLDFAEMYDFRLTGAAQELAEQAREAKMATLVATPAERDTKVTAAPKPGQKPRPLDVHEKVEVADEFKD